MNAAGYFKILADETRLRIVNVLLKHELNVGELVQVMGMSQPRISRHLRILAQAGLVEARRDGLWAFYRCVVSGPGRDFLDQTAGLFEAEAEAGRDIAAAERLVAERARAARRFFDSIAGDWNGLSREVLGGFDLASEILGRVPSCGAAADLGCGPGDLLARLRDRAGLVMGVDSSSRMLEMAAARLGADKSGFSLRIGDLSHLPLRDQEVDCAVMSMVLHHLFIPRAALDEAARVLRPGGTLVVADLDKHELEDMRSQYGDHRLGFERAELVGLLQGAGFQVRDVSEFSVNKGLRVLLCEAERSRGRADRP
ncbi:MAG: metalloregulator ArsR/SmtB family transcription factor [Desulfovibrionaceae bacterium]|nr:metalloregulator ArsR/SmtB family transcription factor [Desulfovibrionaceae bacterium]